MVARRRGRGVAAAPARGGIDPAPVAEGDYFSAGPDRARRGLPRRPAAARCSRRSRSRAACWWSLALGRPASVRRATRARWRGGRCSARPRRAPALRSLIAVATLPTAAVAHERAVDVGLSTQDFGGWLGDAGKSAAIAAVLAGGRRGAADRAACAASPRVVDSRRPPCVALEVVFTWLAPVVLAPLFNHFEPLPAGSRRAPTCSSSAERAGRRHRRGLRGRREPPRSPRSTPTSTGSARPSASSSTTTCSTASRRPELRSVVAHELGHVEHATSCAGSPASRSSRRSGCCSPASSAARVAAPHAAPTRARRRRCPPTRWRSRSPSFVLGVAGNQLSRQVEAGADDFALELTDDPQALIDLQTRLARDQPRRSRSAGLVLSVLFGTHPTTVERIGAALALERDREG